MTVPDAPSGPGPGIVAAALAAVVLWGASPVAAKIAVLSLSPMSVVLFRTVVGGFAALPLVLIMRIPLPAQKSQKFLLIVSGFCAFVAFPVLFTAGVDLTSANHASLILASLPLFTGAIAMAWDRRVPKPLWWAGCAIALTGEMLLISTYKAGGAQESSWLGDGLVLVSNAFASLGYVAGGRLQRQGYPAAGTTFWGVVLFAVILLPFVPFAVAEVEIHNVPFEAWVSVLYLAIGVTIVGYILWYWALGKGGIERISLFQFLQPVSGVALAWMLLGEQLTLTFFIAAALILLGVWFALKAG